MQQTSFRLLRYLLYLQISHALCQIGSAIGLRLGQFDPTSLKQQYQKAEESKSVSKDKKAKSKTVKKSGDSNLSTQKTDKSSKITGQKQAGKTKKNGVVPMNDSKSKKSKTENASKNGSIMQSVPNGITIEDPLAKVSSDKVTVNALPAAKKQKSSKGKKKIKPASSN